MSGRSRPRFEDVRLLTGRARTIANVPAEGALSVRFVRSDHAHARIRRVDVTGAKRSRGVVAVFTSDDVDLGHFPLDVPSAWDSGPWGGLNDRMPRQYLAGDVVRFVGEPIAVVVAATDGEARDAADRVVVEYEPLPAVVDPEQAALDDVLLFPEAGTNVCFEMHGEPLDLSGCDVVVRQRLDTSKIAPCPLEARAAMSSWGPDGRLTHWAGSQGAHPVRDRLADIYGLEPDQVRVITGDVGGAFGSRAASYPEELLCPWLAGRVGRPVRWIEDRTESMLGLGHGRGQIQQVEIGGSRDGRVLAYGLSVLQDSGAYPRVAAILPILTRLMLTGPYLIERWSFRARSVVTNTVPLVAYRGAGRPEATFALERAIDLFASEIGMDPADVRRANLRAASPTPVDVPTGATYDSGDYRRGLEEALTMARYRQMRSEQRRARSRDDRWQIGIGIGTYVEVTALNGGSEYGSIEVDADGIVTVLTGTSPHGQGHETAWATIVADRLGVPQPSVRIVYGDTDRVPTGGLTAGSRGVQIAGSCLATVAEALVERGRVIAADALEADEADVRLVGGAFHVAGSPSRALTWGEIAASSVERTGVPLRQEGALSQPAGTYPSGTHVVVVEVDVETGAVRLRDVVAVDDAGTILNPLLAEGQIHGGLVQGLGQALTERVEYDRDGNPLTTNLADYVILSAAEVPPLRCAFIETPSPLNPLGAKGIGESGVMGSTPALQNAVVDAIAAYGVRHVDIPLTPERVWRAIRATDRS